MASELKPFGYAPGSYMNNCKSCGQSFMGDKRAWNCEPCAKALSLQADTRPAPAATDTGLVTVGYGVLGSLQLLEIGQILHATITRASGGDYDEPVCFRSQADEQLAAKDKTIALAETTMIEMHQDLKKLEADNAAKDAEIALAKTSRDEWGNIAYAAGFYQAECGLEEHPNAKEALDEYRKLKTDNAAQAARIKELEADVKREAQSSTHNAQDCLDEQLRAEALEAKLAAAEKALTQLRSDCQSPIDMYERNGPEFTSPQGNEYESTSHVMAKFAELVAAIDAARAALGGEPS